MEICIASTDGEIRSCFPVMQELRPHLPEESFVGIVREMERDGYALASCKSEGRVVAVAGFRFKGTLYCDHFLYVDDLVTAAAQRSRGFGRALLAWLEDRARAVGCAGVHLDSGMQRTEAHRFYRTHGYVSSSFHFRLDFDSRQAWGNWKGG
jgi:GNAT superfamily N-acetyltransferase